LRLLRQPPDNATAHACAAVIVCADGKTQPQRCLLGWDETSHPAACLRKPATGSFTAVMTVILTDGHFLLQRQKKQKQVHGDGAYKGSLKQ
jgi:hypothetical protein